MKKVFTCIFMLIALFSFRTTFAQCTIDTTDRTVGFTPANPAVISPGVAYTQNVQVYVPPSYNVGGGVVYTVDSLHIDTINGVPNGITYTLNPSTGTVLGGANGVMCFAGITNDSVGLYKLTFTGDVFTNAGPIPFSYLVTLSPSFGYKFRIETTPVAAFTADSPVCASGDTVHFVDHTGGYPTRWAWTFAGGTPATSTSQYPKVVYDSAGTYAVTLIGKNSIANDTITQNITVNPSPTGSVTTTPAFGIASPNGAALVAASGGTPPYTYLWTNSATGDSLNNVVQGTYGVSVTDTKGCNYVNDTVNISFIPDTVNGILQISAIQQVKVYPNPANNVLNLVWSQKSNADVTITDMAGNVIHSYSTTGEMKNTYDVHGLSAGAYVLRISDRTTGQQHSMLFSKF